MKKRLEKMQLKDRINYGYKAVIFMMLLSGVISIIAISVLLSTMVQYVNRVERADSSVKICRMDVNSAAREIREMALNSDTSTYDGYEQNVKDQLAEVDSELKALKQTGIVTDDLYQEYTTALSDWGSIGYSIIEQIKNDDLVGATDAILNQCTPALNNVVSIGEKLDEVTDQASTRAIRSTLVLAIIGIACIIIFLALAIYLANKIGKIVLETILVPMRAIEEVAMELTEGNLHSTLEYHSEDEIGKLAHNMRKSIRILGSYVDDIDRTMKEFAEGNFEVHPQVEWKGDFVGILDSFRAFEASMTDTVEGIQRVSDQVTNGAEQVAASSNDLAEGATSQAAVVQELTATISNVSEEVARNSQSAKEMVDSMNEINQASQEIGKIIATINEIASQTNLLALNASIEAARAGEAGKGFAVVANQVNVLADQSAQAAEESATLIQTSVNAVEKGAVIADQTALQLEDVSKSSKTITQEVANIADTLETQTSEISQINQGIEQINDVVQTNSATSQQCAASSQEMSDQAENLRELIQKLHVAGSNK